MKTFPLTHVTLAKVEPGSLILLGQNGADDERHLAIAVHRAGNPFAVRVVSFSPDRSAMRSVVTKLSAQEAPDRLVLSLGRDFSLEPNLFEQVRTDVRDATALKAGDLLVHDTKQLLVVAPARDTPALVVDLAGAEVTELSAQSVAVFTHWAIFVTGADGHRICLVDTKSHRQATAPSSKSPER
jgi:hypothetical protein